jgi:hypothetical protein
MQPLVTTATPTSFAISPNFNMSFCSGLSKEQQSTPLPENGMEMLVLTLPLRGSSHALDSNDNKVNAVFGSALTNVTTRWERVFRDNAPLKDHKTVGR